jgi:hypothetical protein
MNQSGGDMSSNHSLSIVLIDDSNIVLAQREAMIAEIDGVEVVATANDDAGAIRVVREQLAERVAAQRETKVFIGEALVDEKGAIGEGCLPRGSISSESIKRRLLWTDAGWSPNATTTSPHSNAQTSSLVPAHRDTIVSQKMASCSNGPTSRTPTPTYAV